MRGALLVLYRFATSFARSDAYGILNGRDENLAISNAARVSRLLDGLNGARRSRGTPRIANRLLRRVRDFAEVRSDGTIDAETAINGLSLLNVDEYGLDEMDARVLRAIIETFDGGPVGLSSLAVAVGEDAGTLEEVYEPYLIQNGYLHRTPRGRAATRKAYERFGYALPRAEAEGGQGALFGDGG